VPLLRGAVGGRRDVPGGDERAAVEELTNEWTRILESQRSAAPLVEIDRGCVRRVTRAAMRRVRCGPRAWTGRTCDTRRRLAIVVNHPIQYQAPWFRELSERVELTVLLPAESGRQSDAGWRGVRLGCPDARWIPIRLAGQRVADAGVLPGVAAIPEIARTSNTGASMRASSAAGI
jgi:hypothetical protein